MSTSTNPATQAPASKSELGPTMTGADILNGPALWFANRGTGFVLLLLLTLSTMLGVLSTARVTSRLWPRMLSQGLHRNVSLLAVTFLAAHVTTAVVDTFSVVPFEKLAIADSCDV